MTANWEQREGRSGCVLQIEQNAFISYNPGPIMGNGPETAIVITKDDWNTDFLILEGDWRERYGEVAKNGLTACLEVYNELKKEHQSSWSSDLWDE